jgi:hypothetical protein
LEYGAQLKNLALLVPSGSFLRIAELLKRLGMTQEPANYDYLETLEQREAREAQLEPRDTGR